jgi:hypothetical protein
VNLTVLDEATTQCPIWGVTKTTNIQTPEGLCYLTQHSSGWSLTFADKTLPDDTKDAIERKIKFAYELVDLKGVGVTLAQTVFAYKDNQYRYKPQQLKRMAARAITLLGQLPSSGANTPMERALSRANDYNVNLPNSGWIGILQEYIDG